MGKRHAQHAEELEIDHQKSQLKLGLSAICAVFAIATPVQAEVYGQLGLAASTLSVEDTGSDEGDATQMDLSGFAGADFGSSAFVELDALVTRRSNESDIGANNGLRSGKQFGLRVGRSTQDLSYEGFALWYDYENGDNEDDDERVNGLGFGFGMNYQASPMLNIGAQVGRLLVGDGDGSEVDDTLDETTFVALQGRYQVTPEFAALVRTDFVSGPLAADSSDEDVEGLSLMLSGSYSLTDQLDLFAFAQWDDWEQAGEDDDYQETSFGIGVTYAFGSAAARGQTRMALPNTPRWSANVAGHLE